MTDIPQMYLDEAVRRCNDGEHGCYFANDWTVKVLARTLQELNWQPPVDPMLVRAREIAARAFAEDGFNSVVQCTLDGHSDHSPIVQAALIALREGMGR